MFAARHKTLMRIRSQENRSIDDDDNNDEIANDAIVTSRLVAYCSTQAHSSLARAARLSLVRLRQLEPNVDDEALAGETLAKAIRADRELGLIPFFVCATLGTTGTCAFDRLREIGEVCNDGDDEIWLHVDAAYGGTTLICEEFRHYADGVELANSVVINPGKVGFYGLLLFRTFEFRLL